MVPQRFRSQSAATNEIIQVKVGGELVGCYISIEWPLDRHHYGARILRYIEETGKHIILYGYEEDFATEEVDLNDPSRDWMQVNDPFKEQRALTTPNSLVGRIVSVDARDDDTPQEARDKLACVVAVIHPQIQGKRSRGSRFTCAPAKPLLHRVIWIFGLELDDIDFALHSYTFIH